MSSLIKENSIWKDVKGRTLIVTERLFSGIGRDMKCDEVEMVIIAPLSRVVEKWDEVCRQVACRNMIYLGTMDVVYDWKWKSK